MRNIVAILLCTLVLSSPHSVLADAASDARMAELERTVRNLEQRIAALEKQVGQAGQSSPSVSIRAADSADLRNWRQIREGMSEQDVERLLGSPGKVVVSEYSFIWYYNYPSGGSVNFKGKTRKVGGWSEP
jgi:outer membrane murein-binding lipoprotein Lpp